MNVHIIVVAYGLADDLRKLYESVEGEDSERLNAETQRGRGAEITWHVFLHSQIPPVVEACYDLASRAKVWLYPYGINRGLARSWNEGLYNAYQDGADVALIANDDVLAGPGDVEARMERRLLEPSAAIRSDVLKVAHHGSRTSSTPEFLERVAPIFGIISVGAFKRFGHPNDDVLAALNAAGVRTYRTDQDGTVTISTDGHRLEITALRDTLRPWPPLIP